MIDRIDVLKIAQKLAEHAAARQSVVARNVAHVDTPGYRQLDLPSFKETYRDADGANAMRTTRAGHFGGAPLPAAARAFAVEDGVVAPNGNTVSLEDEILKSAEIRQQHDMALSIYSSGLGVIRASLGRR